MLEQIGKSKPGMALLASCVGLIIFMSLPRAAKTHQPLLGAAAPDPNGTPVPVVGRSSRLLDQPVRDNSLDELLKRD